MRAVLVFFTIASCATVARGEDKAKARDLYRVGTQDYNLAEYDKALDAFKEAYRNFEDPIFLFNIGQCHRQLGHQKEAIGFYRAYLRNSPDATNREEVNSLISKLESEIADENAATRAAPAPASKASDAVNPALPAATVATPVRVSSQADTSMQASKPVYKRWWFWTVAGVVAAGAAAGIAVAVTQTHSSSPVVPTELGNYRF